MVALLGGCASDYTSYYSEDVEQTLAQVTQWQTQNESASDVTALNALLQSEPLDELVNEAIGHNPDLQRQIIALQTAKVGVRVANADRLPNLSAGFTTSDSESNATQYSGSVAISWEIDLWKQLTDQVAAAKWAVTASEADLHAVHNELVAAVMRAYIDISYFQQLVEIEQQRLTLFEDNEAVILKRYRTGLGSVDDLDSAKTSSASTRASIAAYTQSLTESVGRLGVLLGRTQLSVEELILPTSLPTVLLPLPQVPRQNLEQRPDLISAFADIKAQEYNTKVAYKALLPSINLSAALTDSASSPSQALLNNPVWSVLGQITAPLFQGGALRANIETQELAVMDAWWGYQSTLLTAVQEVENALSQENSLVAQLNAIEEAFSRAQRSSDNYTNKYRQGLVDIVDLLDVYQQTYDLKAQRLQLHYSQLNNRIELGLALGLGAWT